MWRVSVVLKYEIDECREFIISDPSRLRLIATLCINQKFFDLRLGQSARRKRAHQSSARCEKNRQDILLIVTCNANNGQYRYHHQQQHLDKSIHIQRFNRHYYYYTSYFQPYTTCVSHLLNEMYLSWWWWTNISGILFYMYIVYTYYLFQSLSLYH